MLSPETRRTVTAQSTHTKAQTNTSSKVECAKKKETPKSFYFAPRTASSATDRPPLCCRFFPCLCYNISIPSASFHSIERERKQVRERRMKSCTVRKHPRRPTHTRIQNAHESRTKVREPRELHLQRHGCGLEALKGLLDDARTRMVKNYQNIVTNAPSATIISSL